MSLAFASNFCEYLFYESAVRHSIGLVDEVLNLILDVVVVIFGLCNVERGELVESLGFGPVTSDDFHVLIFYDGEAKTVGMILFYMPRHRVSRPMSPRRRRTPRRLHLSRK